jgi:hypothetical protein
MNFKGYISWREMWPRLPGRSLLARLVRRPFEHHLPIEMKGTDLDHFGHRHAEMITAFSGRKGAGAFVLEAVLEGKRENPVLDPAFARAIGCGVGASRHCRGKGDLGPGTRLRDLEQERSVGFGVGQFVVAVVICLRRRGVTEKRSEKSRNDKSHSQTAGQESFTNHITETPRQAGRLPPIFGFPCYL